MMLIKIFILCLILFLVIADKNVEKSDEMVSSKSGFLESKSQKVNGTTRKSWGEKIKESFLDSIIGIKNIFEKNRSITSKKSKEKLFIFYNFLNYFSSKLSFFL